jgi:hypothetical protein
MTRKELAMGTRPVRGLPAAFVVVLPAFAWLVIGAAAAHVRDGPDDPTTPYVTRPDPSMVVVTESVSWTRYALVAAIAVLVGVAASLVVQLVLRHTRGTTIAHD